MRQNQGINQEKENQKSEKLGRKQPKEENRKLRVEDRGWRDKSAIGAAKMPRRTVGEAEEDGDKDGETKERERERVQSK